jgi:predicted DNA repair protein MutK
MSGLLALLDDIAALARLAAVQVDDIAGQAAKVGGKVVATVWDDAAKAGTKAAGVVIDDAAVTPKYVTGLPATRELPIVWQIAKGSLFNKLVILLPAAMLLSVFAPWLLPVLLILGGAYLCYEGAEKVLHAVTHQQDDHAPKPQSLDAAHLERTRIASAVKTDFILSAEIMVLSLATIEADGIILRASILAIVAIGITAIVYGTVAILVKADDFGLRLAQTGRFGWTRGLGHGIVKAMPRVMTVISVIGTAAMLWVGGSIVLHQAAVLGFAGPYDAIHHLAEAAASAVASARGLVEWMVTAAIDGVFGLALGLLLIPVAKYLLIPVAGLFQRRKAA